jgi:hypothetical protein
MRGARHARIDTQYAMSEQYPSRDAQDRVTDLDSDLDPFLRSVFEEARAAQAQTPDHTGVAEHVVGRLLGGPVLTASRVRAARVDAALRRRPDLRRRAESMERRLARLAARAEDPGEMFERVREEARRAGD